jgi:FLYWCH zinc finger domain
MATISNNGTTKNKPRLDHDGYSYIMDRSTNEKTYWRCIKYSSDHCRSRLHTCILTNVIAKPPSEHTCKLDGTTMQLRVFNEHIANRAINTQETPETIITNCYKGKNAWWLLSNESFCLLLVDMSDPSIARLPVRENIKRRIRMLRQKNQVVKAPNDPNFSSVPTPLTTTLRNNQFLRCDTGPGMADIPSHRSFFHPFSLFQ